METRAYINGSFLIGDKRYPIISPITLKECGTAPALTNKEINLAFNSARTSQKSWAKLSREERINYIEEFKNELLQKKDEIAKIVHTEIGKPIQSAIIEIERTASLITETIYAYHSLLLTNINGNSIGVPNKMISIIREPLGVVLAISPFNYPINLSLAKIIPAIISGNTVVFKPATNGSIVAGEIAKIFHNIRLPEGVFNLVTGRGSEIGDYLITHKEPNVITYTGSTKVGLNISKNAFMQNIILEMGGKDAAIVLKDADIEYAAKNIAEGAFSYSGQRCTAIKRVYVDKTIKVKFQQELKNIVKDITWGSSEDGNTVVPLITLASAKFQKKLINDAIKKGAKKIYGGEIIKNLVQPTLLTNVTENMLIANEEQFGPVLPILEFKDIDEVIKRVNDSQFGLQASIFTENEEEALKVSNNLEVGSVNINCSPSRGPDQLPFTGVKNSGFGVQGIKYAIESMTRPKNFVLFGRKKKKFSRK